MSIYDVAVLGGGNAALCAALAAAERGARVIVVERAPREFRGGNSRHTRNLRCMHTAPTDVLTDAYTEDEFMADVLRVTGGVTNEALARMMIRASADAPRRMGRFGVRFQPSLRGTLHLGRTNAFFLGGGKALLNSAYAAAERLGVRIAYDADVIGVSIRDGRFESATVRMAAGDVEVSARSVVLAAGGFESNLEWLAEIWGDAAKNFIIRGTPYNTGTVLRLMLDAGAETVGDPAQCHAVAIDARAPKFDGGIVTRLDSIPLGIVVNKHGDRFYDEGEDYWPKRYAIWGRLVAQQPDQIAYSIVDSKAVGRFMPSVFPPLVATSIRELAAAIDVPAGTLASTIERFNAAVRPGTFDHQALDDCRTEGLVPNKTHWAQRLDTPPFHAYPLRPGITFTYLGVKVDERTRVVMKGGVAENIFAAGEIMAGNILGRGYVAGVGMTIGTVFGEMAGTQAAQIVS
ncbi:MAG TPA: FAD-dependent tricarballylate dehydrogenase TcuA [Vicinamibacterales bacterium]